VPGSRKKAARPGGTADFDRQLSFVLRRNIRELLELSARKVAFFERNEVHSSLLLKHENVFYRVKKGDLFFELFV
jgi:hypothetical protein